MLQILMSAISAPRKIYFWVRKVAERSNFDSYQPSFKGRLSKRAILQKQIAIRFCLQFPAQGGFQLNV
jgi:hypothetical protein